MIRALLSMKFDLTITNPYYTHRVRFQDETPILEHKHEL